MSSANLHVCVPVWGLVGGGEVGVGAVFEIYIT